MTPTTQHERSPQTADDVELDPVVEALTAAHARAKLTNAADQVAYVRGLVVPSGSQPSDGQPRSSSTEASFPIRVDPLEASDRVYAHLLNWVRFWSAEMLVQPPVAAVYAWTTDGGPQGFRSTVTPLGAWGLTSTLATWLLLHHDSIRRQPRSGEYFAQIDSVLWHLQSRFPTKAPKARPVLPRPCPVCAADTMTIERRGLEVTDIGLVCSYCGFEGDAAALVKDRAVRALLTDIRFEEAPPAAEWWTKAQAVDEMRLTPQTLNRYIQHEGLETHTKDGVVWVKADDVRDLWRAKQVRRLRSMRRPVGAEPDPEG
ncbi:hypothetical protein ACWGJ9_07320 [Curtobacterium citreum]